jgi:hypothetical protein
MFHTLFMLRMKHSMESEGDMTVLSAAYVSGSLPCIRFMVATVMFTSHRLQAMPDI